MSTLPLYIIKKSRTWYYNTVTGKYIHKDKLATAVSEQDKTLSTEEYLERKAANDRGVRNKRWDLNYD